MWRSIVFFVLLAFAFSNLGFGQTAPGIADPSAFDVLSPCSTEIVNRHNCSITIDRNYPMALPNIQLDKGVRVQVIVINALAFENLSLDFVSGQQLPPADQAAAFASQTLPLAKSFVATAQMAFEARVAPANLFSGDLLSLNTLDTFAASVPDRDAAAAFKQALIDLNKTLDDPTVIRNEAKKALDDASDLYSQLSETQSVIPRPLAKKDSDDLSILRDTVRPSDAPSPFLASGMGSWKTYLLLELEGGNAKPSPYPKFVNLIDRLTGLQKPVELSGFDEADFDAQYKQAEDDIAALPQGDPQTKAKRYLALVLQKKNTLMTILAAYGSASTSVVKDLDTYAVNIEAIDTTKPQIKFLGFMYDVRERKETSAAKGVLVPGSTWTVTAVNLVATSPTIVPTTSAKKQILSLSIVHADPVFEVSTGAFFSTLPSRSFSNTTLVTQNAGASPTLGNVVIAQTLTRPVVVPFVAANWRLLPNFKFAHRRSAFYFTTAVGVNPYNTTTEFGFGGSLSWRSFMISGLYHLGHDVRLTQGETVGMVWCNTTAANSDGTIPKCSGNPPPPSTEKFWTGAFGLGVSVRIPISLGTGASSSASK